MAEAYFGRALAELFECNYEPALAEFEQALKLIGDRPASYLLGKIYTNMAGACWFLKRPHDGIRYLEQAISYYERTEHKANATDGYNNLGITLILVGDWDRAQEALEHALSLASEVDRQGAKVPMILWESCVCFAEIFRKPEQISSVPSRSQPGTETGGIPGSPCAPLAVTI
jgi:tetratricopeptide (TPR) repeat protein